jgi:UDP-glucose 4-epimerase
MGFRADNRVEIDMAKVLVIGGAGYVGGSTAAFLIDQGHNVWVLDDLSTGNRDFVLGEGFTHCQLGDQNRVRELLSTQKFDCIFHFAAKSLVSESIQKRDEYFENNVIQTERLLEVLAESSHLGHKKIIFSSSCAVYGDPGTPEIDESCAKKPLNPYGETKLAAERLLERFARDHGVQAIALRYFNAAGADPQLRTGELHHPETHLLPRIVKACLEKTPIYVYGTDYPTDDGTCVRDYIHVWDLARAHESAMKRLLTLQSSNQGRFEAYNLGSQNGFSVREVIDGCFLVSGHQTQVIEKPRRAGDSPMLVADSMLAQKVLGFTTEKSFEDVIHDGFRWEEKKKSFSRRAVFLDRDGTLNEDPGYLNDPEKLKLFPQVEESLRKLKNAGFLLVVISNQSGVGRGLIDPEMLPKIHDRLNHLLAPFCAMIDHFKLCVHRPEDDCDCRKPKPKLIEDAAKELGVDIKRSYMVGDKISDVDAGRNAGCKGTVLVCTGWGEQAVKQLKNGQADFVGAKLSEVADWILSQETSDR